MKLLTAAIPCYNSAAYMHHAIDTLLTGGEEMEIIIVNDGSSDDTQKIAEEYQAKYPNIIRAIKQENGGHGEAVNTGLANATGLYFKVVDSDDWVNERALRQVMETLKNLIADGNSPDLFLANYVYEKVDAKKKKVINYNWALPKDQIFTWDDMMHFKQSQNILMHSTIYRTKLLKSCGIHLPKHTFYVDNIFVYQPLPYVKTLYYLDVNLYRYFIGRSDQSVNEQVMIRRIDQQLKITKIMIESHNLMQIKSKKLQNYMIKYLSMMMTVSSVFLIKEGSDESLAKKQDLWDYLKNYDRRLYKKIRSQILGRSMNLPGKFGRRIVEVGYNITKKIYGFN
jgi:glycosyltransferase involved in cell wall biosynthesis